MSATSNIHITPELASLFADANLTGNTRFIKVSIHNETLVNQPPIPINGSFEEDLALIQASDVLEDSMPTYLLAYLQPSSWLAISYVPDSARVRDKMLYASTRATLLKDLGANLFTDTLFATSKADLTPEAYAAHRRHMTAPNPLTAREQEMADLRASESSSAYEGSRGRMNHVGPGVGFQWSQEAEEAVVRLGQDTDCSLVVLKIDQSSENLVLHEALKADISNLGKSLPSSDPCFAFFQLSSVSRGDIVFIYSCPSSSPIKSRMVYSTGMSTVFLTAKQILGTFPSSPDLLSRKIETSNPLELDEAYLNSEFNVDNTPTLDAVQSQPRLFAKPKGPPRRR